MRTAVPLSRVVNGSACSRRLSRRRQHGASLIVALLMLVAVLMIGLSAAQIALQGEKASRNDRDRQIALQAAEAALMDAELDIENATGPNSRSALFHRHSTEGFTEGGCGSGSGNIFLGLCQSAEGAPPVWQTMDFRDESANASYVTYGQFTGQTFASGNGSLPGKLPRYIIELMVYTENGQPAEPPSYVYRVTAIGFGTRPSTQVVVQTLYYKDGM